MKLGRFSMLAIAATACAVAALAFAPVLWAELSLVKGDYASSLPPSRLASTPAGPIDGQVIDGRWRVQKIGTDTYALGEPADVPDNYEYLLIGKTRALLIDAGATRRDIHSVLNRLTRLPVTVLPSHLHSDHTNGLRYFSDIALIDLPDTRALVRNGAVHLSPLAYMGALNPDAVSMPAPTFKVSEWVKPDSIIDLGDRKVRILWTPGHTTTSVSVLDPSEKLLFTGDTIYTTTIYAFMADSSVSTYIASADRLLAHLPADTTLYGAHCCRNDRPATAPWLAMQDLRDLRTALADVKSGRATGQGFLLRRYPVNARMTLATFYPFGNR